MLEHHGGEPRAVMSLAGQAGIQDCSWVGALLELQAAQGVGRTVVDLSRLSGMDWWAALMLGWVGRVISRRGGELVLISASPAVVRMMAAGSRQVARVGPTAHSRTLASVSVACGT